MNAAQLDLEFDKDSWLRAEFQFLKPTGELDGVEDHNYRFIAKESLETEDEMYNILMPKIPFGPNEEFWMTKVEIYRPATNVDPDLLHYIIRQENPEPGNEDSDEIVIFGTLTLNKRI